MEPQIVSPLPPLPDFEVMKNAMDILTGEYKKAQTVIESNEHVRQEVLRLSRLVEEKDVKITERNEQHAKEVAKREQVERVQEQLCERVKEVQASSIRSKETQEVEITRLNATIQELQANLTQTVHDKNSEISILTEKIKAVQTSAARSTEEKISEVSNLSSSLDEEKAEVYRLSCTVEERDYQLVAFEERLIEETKQRQEAEEKILQFQSRLKDVEDNLCRSVAMADGKAMYFSSIVEEKDREIELCGVRLCEEAKKVDDEIKANQLLRETIQEMKNTNDALTNQRDEAEEDNVMLRHHLRKSKKDLQEVEKKYMDKRNMWKDMKQEIEELTSQTNLAFEVSQKLRQETAEPDPDANAADATAENDVMLLLQRAELQQKIQKFEVDIAAVMAAVTENREKLQAAEEKYLQERHLRELTEEEVMKLQKQQKYTDLPTVFSQEAEQEVITLEAEVSAFRYLNHDLSDALQNEKKMRTNVEKELLELQKRVESFDSHETKQRDENKVKEMENTEDDSDGPTGDGVGHDRVKSQHEMELQTLKLKLLSTKRSLIEAEKRYKSEKRLREHTETQLTKSRKNAVKIDVEEGQEIKVKEKCKSPHSMLKERAKSIESKLQKMGSSFLSIVKVKSKEFERKYEVEASSSPEQEVEIIVDNKAELTVSLSLDEQFRSVAEKLDELTLDSSSSGTSESDDVNNGNSWNSDKVPTLTENLTQKVKDLEAELIAVRSRCASLQTSLNEAQERYRAERKLCEKAEKKVMALQVRARPKDPESSDDKQSTHLSLLVQLRDEFSQKVGILEAELSMLQDRCTTTKDFLKKAEDRYERERKLREAAEVNLRGVLWGVSKSGSACSEAAHLSKHESNNAEHDQQHIISDEHEARDEVENEARDEVVDISKERETEVVFQKGGNRETCATDISLDEEANEKYCDEIQPLEETLSESDEQGPSKMGPLKLVSILKIAMKPPEVDIRPPSILKVESEDSGVMDALEIKNVTGAAIQQGGLLITADAVTGDCEVNCQLFGCSLGA